MSAASGDSVQITIHITIRADAYGKKGRKKDDDEDDDEGKKSRGNKHRTPDVDGGEYEDRIG